MIKRVSGLSFALCVSLLSDVLYMDDLIKEALVNSPDIKISTSQYEAAVQRSNIAGSDYLPQVNIGANLGKSHTDFGNQSFAGRPIQNVNNDILTGSVSASQLLYDFGKTGGNMDDFEQRAKASKASLAQDISNKIFAVKKSYYDLLTKQALIEVNKENVKLNEQQLNRSQKYFKAGIRTKVDVTDAKVNLIQAQLSLQNVQYDTKLALVKLYQEVGFNNNKKNIEVYIEQPALKDVYKSLNKLQFSEDYYKKEAYKNRAELKQYHELLKASISQNTKIDGDYFPELYANGDYFTQKAQENTISPKRQWTATLSLRWNVFAGNRTSAQSEEARINTLKAQADLDKVKLRIQKEISDAFIKVNKELDNTRLSQSLSLASNEKFIQAGKRYEHGLADFVELQQARQSYIDSRASLTQSYYRFYTAVAELNRAAGK